MHQHFKVGQHAFDQGFHFAAAELGSQQPRLDDTGVVEDQQIAGVQQNTQVSIGVRKNFFKDRLGVQIGTSINVPNSNSSASQYNASNITGDIVIDYKLTPDGRFHFKVFRLNQYEGIIDGLLYKTGISLLYNKDYNTLRELFSKRSKAPEPKPEEKKSE